MPSLTYMLSFLPNALLHHVVALCWVVAAIGILYVFASVAEKLTGIALRVTLWLCAVGDLADGVCVVSTEKRDDADGV